MDGCENLNEISFQYSPFQNNFEVPKSRSKHDSPEIVVDIKTKIVLGGKDQLFVTPIKDGDLRYDLNVEKNQIIVKSRDDSAQKSTKGQPLVSNSKSVKKTGSNQNFRTPKAAANIIVSEIHESPQLISEGKEVREPQSSPRFLTEDYKVQTSVESNFTKEKVVEQPREVPTVLTPEDFGKSMRENSRKNGPSIQVRPTKAQALRLEHMNRIEQGRLEDLRKEAKKRENSRGRGLTKSELERNSKNASKNAFIGYEKFEEQQLTSRKNLDAEKPAGGLESNYLSQPCAQTEKFLFKSSLVDPEWNFQPMLLDPKPETCVPNFVQSMVLSANTANLDITIPDSVEPPTPPAKKQNSDLDMSASNKSLNALNA